MSEFVECQNCGRTFLAENLDCPYCGGQDEDDAEEMVTDLMRTVAPSTRGPEPRRVGGGLFGVLFAGFALLAAAIAVAAVAGFLRADDAPSRAWLACEAAFAIVAVVGVIGRRRWGRGAAIAFIAWNTVLGLAPLVASNWRPIFIWGPGPAVLLLFAWPFLSPQARERFTR